MRLLSHIRAIAAKVVIHRAGNCILRTHVYNYHK